MRNFVLFFLALFLIWFFSSPSDYVAIRHFIRSELVSPSPTQGNLAPNDPVQTPIGTGEVAPWTMTGYMFTLLAHYSITGRIMHTAMYTFDNSSAISPLDFAFGWGRMSDPAVYGQLNIGQSGRWYSYSWSSQPPIPEDEIISHSANTHLIPANDQVRDQLYDFDTGDVVNLNGFLVHVDGPNGFTWTSSLSRTDTGAGSCEVMWVNSAAKVGR